MAILDNIISSWKFDESSGNAADSAGANTLTNVGTATFEAGKINNATHLDGSTQKFSIADASQSGLDITGDWSCAMWVNHDTTPSSGNQSEYLSKYGALAGNRSYLLQLVNNGGTLQLTAGNNDVGVAVDWTPSTGVWYFVGLTYNDSANEMKFYVNGSQQGTTQTQNNNPPNGAAAFQLGGFDIAGIADFDGLIDDATIWSRTLTLAEMSFLYNGGTGLQYPFTASQNSNFLMFMPN